MMKNNRQLSFLLLILMVSLLQYDSMAQSTQWTNKTATEWIKSNKWFVGSRLLTPHSSIDKVEFARQYEANKSWWDKGFAYLKETDLASLKAGRYPIDGDNVFALVTEGPPKEFDSSRFESHKNFIDIHYVISGKEKIGAATISAVKITQEYMPERDLTFYSGNGKYYEADQSGFFVFFPKTAHRPGIKVDGYNAVKKIVIKIRNAP
jgi:YhcH/YjgK/YiaL family protein